LVGPPNVGKSTLFYALTGRYVKTANYPGKTLDLNVGYVRRYGIEVVDLPGVFDPWNPKDEDEKLAIEEALSDKYDAVVVVGAPHAMREALALAEFLSRRKPVVFVFNMADLGTPGAEPEELSAKWGIPVFYTSAARRRGVEELARFLASWTPAGPTPVKLEEVSVKPTARLAGAIFSRPWAAFTLLIVLSAVTVLGLLAAVEGILPWGAEVPGLLPLVEPYLDLVPDYIRALGLPAWLTSLLVNGAWTGVSAFVTFIPYVVAAVALVTFYEESGVIGALARTLEMRFASLGIPGRGLLCLAVGSTCNVPAISTVKVMWGRGNRVLTALLVPYVPCAARLSLFVAVAAAVLANRPYLIPLAVFLPYAASGVAILLASLIYRRALRVEPRVEGLPPTPLMWPSGRIYALKVWAYLKDFLTKAGPLIVLLPLALWPLTAFGPGGFAVDMSHSWLAVFGQALAAAFEPMGIPWQITTSLVAGYIFKELVWAFMGALGAVDLLPALSLPSALALLVFLAFYSACIATTAMLIRQVGLRLTALSLVVQLLLGLAFAYATYFTALALLETFL